MREVEIPGGTAQFLETSGETRDEIPGRAVKLIKAATMAAGTHLSGFPEIFSPPIEVEDAETGDKRLETPEERTARLAPTVDAYRFTTEQAMSFDNIREATVVALLHSWTLDRRLPTLETIGDLPSELYQTLLDAVGGMSTKEIEENFDDTTGHPPKFAKGEEAADPTGGSGSSSTASSESQPLHQIQTSPSDTSPPDGASSSPEQ